MGALSHKLSCLVEYELRELRTHDLNVLCCIYDLSVHHSK